VLVGALCGLAGVVLIRAAVAALVGGIRLVLLALTVGLVWLAYRRLRPRR
jgi:hypothetical protein